MTYAIYQHSDKREPFTLVLIGHVEAESAEEALGLAKADGISAPLVAPTGAMQ